MTATILFANNAKSTLAAPINTAATSLTLTAGTGALFPSPSGGNYFVLVLTDAATGNTFEVLHVTARTGDVCTVTRAQESTIALNWTTGDFANNVVTAGTMDALQSGAGGGGTALAWVVVAGTSDADVVTAVAAINASPNGGVIYFPPGNYANLPGGYEFTKPVTMIGCGCADAFMVNAITIVSCESQTAILFNFSVDPWQVNDIHLVNTSSTTPTDGAAIYSAVGSGHRLNNVTTYGFYNNWQVDNAANWYWTNSVSVAPVNYAGFIRNIGLPDGGDQGIVNCQFNADKFDAPAAIRWESGGGLRITNCKFNAFLTGNKFEVMLDIYMQGNTVDLLISNSGMENFTVSGIRGRIGSGQLTDLIINGVQFGNYGTTSVPIDIQAVTFGQFDRVMIASCLFVAPSSTVAPISLANIRHVTIGPCEKLNHPSMVSLVNVQDFRNSNAQWGVGTLVDAPTILVDVSNNESLRVVISGNRTLGNPTNMQDGQTCQIRVYQDSVGGNTLSFDTKYRFPNGTAPVMPTAANAGGMLSFQYEQQSDTCWLVAALGF